MENLEQFIDLDKNDLIKEMSKKEVMHFFDLLNQYDLEYRERLGLLKKYTFGIEIEAEFVDGGFHKEISQFYKKGWIREDELSLDDGDEYISPILTDDINTWKDVKGICNILNRHYEIKNTCGGHIHIGTHILGPNEQSYRNFIKLWSTYENIIFRFSYGEFLNPRNKILDSAGPVSNHLFKITKENSDFYSKYFWDIVNSCRLNTWNAVNFYNIKNKQKGKNNTIEIRCPNGTLNPIIWQNNINFFLKFMLYCKNEKFDEDILTERRLINGQKYRLEDYNKIYLEQTIELADLIFNNNLDKVYFLRQYLKSFQIGFKTDGLEKARQFTK